MNEPARNKRELLRDAKRQRVQRVARRVFAERGFAGTQMEEIARRCATSVGAIYLLFESKEALCLSFLSEAADAFEAQWTRVAHEASLERLILVTANILGRRPELVWSIALLSEPASRKTSARGIAWASADAWLAACRAMLQQAGQTDPNRAQRSGEVLLGIFVAEIIRRNLGFVARPLEQLFSEAGV